MFSERLKEMRMFRNSKLTQQEVAQQLDMSQSKISRLECGATEPTTEEIIILCKYYNVSSDYLLGLTDEYRPLQK